MSKILKAKIVPVRFKEANEREITEFDVQLDNLKTIYGDVAEFLEPVMMGDTISGANAIVFPQLIGACYNYRDCLKTYDLPIVVLTSSFGTVEMWDWEIVTYLREDRLSVFSPYSIELAKVTLRAMAVKSHMKTGAKFLMFQDDPGEGMQANIFKRFYWWEQQCTRQMEDAFGCKIVYRSWKEVNARAEKVSDEEAMDVFESWNIEHCELTDCQKILPAKLYIAIKEVIEEIGGVDGIGANCLNESMYCKTTPCIVWNMLFELEDIIWCCEGDTLTMLSTYVLYHSLKQPIMMTNIYPFLVGDAAVAHEKIDGFPKVNEPQNCALGVHCGYAGFAPRKFCTRWDVMPKVLEIVGENAHVVDCEFATGDITLAKITPSFKDITIIPAVIEEYIKFPNTDARNASLIRYNKGETVMEELSSHHQMIIGGRQEATLHQVAKVFDWNKNIIQ